MSSQLAQHPDRRPPSGIMRLCRVTEVYDGDTVTVELITRARVRMIDCWAKEVRGTEGEEKALALQARDHLSKLALNKEGEIFIPLDDADRLDDVLSMGRVLGVIWIGDDKQSLSQQQVEAGLASTSKNGALGG